MIRHVCMFTLKNDNKEKNINDFFEEIEKLKELATIKKFNVVKNVENTPDTNYDVALIFDFDSVETLDEYQTCKEHLEFAKFLATIKVNRACIDYEI